MGEKPRTYADVRREEFQRHAKAAKDLADLSLRDIDAVLAEEDQFIAAVHESVEQNGEELSEAEILWEAFRRKKEQ